MMNPAEFANIASAERDFWWYRGMREVVSRVLNPWLHSRRVVRALEAGCGTGFFARRLQDELGWQVYPADLAWEGLSYARGMGLNRLSQADLAALPFRDGAFDVVTSMEVLVHFARGEEQRPLAEMARVLAPGGLLILRVSALEMLRSRHSQFVEERQRFTRRRLICAAAAAGLRVLRCTYANSLLLPVALAKFRVWEPLLRKKPESGVRPVPRWLDSLLYSFLRAESAWLGAGFDLPLGQSLLLLGEKKS
jgi:ubiquinone/menaquinone biosynthesis C-methylase UbiE